MRGSKASQHPGTQSCRKLHLDWGCGRRCCALLERLRKQIHRLAARTFARRPGFTAVAALTVALGIGATTTVFSMVDAVLFRPLSYRNPERLAAVWVTSTRENSLAKIFATHADYVEFRSHARTLEDVAAATWATRTGGVLSGYGPAREVLTIPASASFFDTLGVSAAIGRTFIPEDEGRGCSLVVTHKF